MAVHSETCAACQTTALLTKERGAVVARMVTALATNRHMTLVDALEHAYQAGVTHATGVHEVVEAGSVAGGASTGPAAARTDAGNPAGLA